MPALAGLWPAQRQIELSHREIAQILAALRNWQIDTLNEDLAEAFASHFERHPPLSDEDIEELCEKLNYADGQVVTTGAF